MESSHVFERKLRKVTNGEATGGALGADQNVLQESQLSSDQRLTIILGQPGSGKSKVMKRLEERTGGSYVQAHRFIRNTDLFAQRDKPLIIDGVDELATSPNSHAMGQVLTKLESIGSPDCILSCRDIEWKEALDRNDFTEMYGENFDVFYLQPLAREDAKSFLISFASDGKLAFNSDEIEEVLNSLDSSGLSGFYSNAYDLQLFAESFANQKIPSSREELYFHAADQQSKKESSVRHKVLGNVAGFSADELLNAAGIISLAEIVSGAGFVATKQLEESGSFIDIRALKDLPHSSALNAVCGTRLINAMQGTGRVRSAHRTMGDYLAARYILESFDLTNARIVRRIWNTLVPDAVPSSDRRGLISWLGRNNAFATYEFRTDPVGYIYYGDLKVLDGPATLELLEALEEYSNSRPEFYSYGGLRNFDVNFGKGEREVVEKIVQLLEGESTQSELKLFLLELLKGSPQTSSEMRGCLCELILNPANSFPIRFRAVDVLLTNDTEQIEWPLIADQLISEQQEVSSKLGLKIIRGRPKNGLSAAQVAQIVIGCARLDPEIQVSEPRVIGTLWEVAENLEPLILLDCLTHIEEAAVFQDGSFFRRSLEDDGPMTGELAIFVSDALLKIQSHGALTSDDSLKWHTVVGQRDFLNNKDFPSANSEFCREIEENVEFANDVLNKLLASKEIQHLSPEKVWSPDFLEVFDNVELNDEILTSALQFVIGQKLETDEINENSLIIFSWALNDQARYSNAFELAHKLSRRGQPFYQCSIEARAYRRQRDEELYAEMRVDRENRALQREDEWQDIVRVVQEEIPKEQPNLNILYNMSALVLGKRTSDNGQMASSATITDKFGAEIFTRFSQVLEQRLRMDQPCEFDYLIDKSNHGLVVKAVLIEMAAAAFRYERGESFDNLAATKRETLWLASQSDNYQNNNFLNNGTRIDDKLNVTLDRQIEILDKAVRAQLTFDGSGEGDSLISLRHSIRGLDGSNLATLIVGWINDFPNITAEPLRVLTNHLESSRLDEAWSVQLAELSRKRALETRKQLEVIDPNDVDSIANLNSKMGIWDTLAFKHARSGPLPDDEPNKPLFKKIFMSISNVKTLTIEQIEALISRFSEIAIDNGEPDPYSFEFGTHGGRFTRTLIKQLGDSKSEDSVGALERLLGLDNTHSDYILTVYNDKMASMESAIVETLDASAIKTMLLDGAPQTSSQLLSLGLDLIETLQGELAGTSNNPYKQYYIDHKEYGWTKPKIENDCNEVTAQLMESPENVISNIELQLANEKRCDIGLQTGDLLLPIEAKGQWNSEVYSAAMGQLDSKYASHFQARGHGILLVYWFGHDVIPEKKPLSHPEKGRAPRSPRELKDWILEGIPKAHRDRLRVFVLDVTLGLK